jgi:hypothetical protein
MQWSFVVLVSCENLTFSSVFVPDVAVDADARACTNQIEAPKKERIQLRQNG